MIPEAGAVSYSIDEGRESSSALYLFAHGAGAGYNHPWMEKMAFMLCERGISVLRFNFPYMERGKRPGSPKEAVNTFKAVVDLAKTKYPKHRIFTGGKSYGGRMASLAASDGVLTDVKGLIFYGFPLHRPGVPSTERVTHFDRIDIPMFFVQGSSDKLAYPDFLLPVIESSNSEYILEEGADHSLNVPKKLNKNPEEVLNSINDEVVRWIEKINKS